MSTGHSLAALDGRLLRPLRAGIVRGALIDAKRGHVVATGQFVGIDGAP